MFGATLALARLWEAQRCPIGIPQRHCCTCRYLVNQRFCRWLTTNRPRVVGMHPALGADFNAAGPIRSGLSTDPYDFAA